MSASFFGIAAVAVIVALWLGWALRRSNRLLLAVIGIGVPAASVAVYASLGSPAQPDLPIAVRAEPEVKAAQEMRRFRQMTGVLVERLQGEPQNIEGWTMLTRAYRHMEEWAFAADAWRHVIRLKGDAAQASDWVEMADLQTRAADGKISPGARESLRRALDLQPDNAQAIHFVALARAQDGDLAGAAGMWRSLLANGPTDAPWRGLVQQYLAQAERQMAAPLAGPSQDDVAAAQEMSDEDRAAMIQSMVERLADRLAEEPDDPTGWLRLGRAYGVLGRTEEAEAALARAAETAEAQLAGATEEDAAGLRAIIANAEAMRERL